MVVYAETVFFNNFVIDAAVLSASARSVRAQKSILRLCLGAGIGAIFATVSPLIPFGGIKLLALKTGVGALIAKCGMKTRGGKRFLLSYVTFFGYTFLLGGAVSGICGLLNLPVNGVHASLFFPVAYLLFRLCLGAFHAGKKMNGVPALYYEITLQAKGGVAKARGFLDTGNRMEKNGQPVFAVSPRVFALLYRPGEKLSSYAVQTAMGETQTSVIPLRSAKITANGKTQTLRGGYALLTKTPLPLAECEVLLGAEALTQAEGEKGEIAV